MARSICRTHARFGDAGTILARGALWLLLGSFMLWWITEPGADDVLRSPAPLLQSDVDIETMFARDKAFNEAMVARLEQGLRSDQPMIWRYLGFLGDMARGDFGPAVSVQHLLTTESVLNRLANSFILVTVAMFLAALTAGALRLLAWLEPIGALRSALGVVIHALNAAPILPAVYLFILVFAVRLNWVDAIAYAEPDFGLVNRVTGLFPAGACLALFTIGPLLTPRRIDLGEGWPRHLLRIGAFALIRAVMCLVIVEPELLTPGVSAIFLETSPPYPGYLSEPFHFRSGLFLLLLAIVFAVMLDDLLASQKRRLANAPAPAAASGGAIGGARRDFAEYCGWSLLALLAFFGIFGPALAPFDAQEIVGRAFLQPGDDPRFLLGVNQIGRDMFSLICAGATKSLAAPLGVAALSVGVGFALHRLLSWGPHSGRRAFREVARAVLFAPNLVLAMLALSWSMDPLAFFWIVYLVPASMMATLIFVADAFDDPLAPNAFRGQAAPSPRPAAAMFLWPYAFWGERYGRPPRRRRILLCLLHQAAMALIVFHFAANFLWSEQLYPANWMRMVLEIKPLITLGVPTPLFPAAAIFAPIFLLLLARDWLRSRE